MLKKNNKIYVAGHTGLVGTALVKKLQQREYKNLVLRHRHELDLMDAKAVLKFYENERPNVVIVAAAKVGGIIANNSYPADFIYQNLVIQNNLIWNAHLNDVSQLVFLGSSCIYPKLCPQPMKEAYLMTGPLESTNRPYALAKIAGLELVHAIRRQFNRNYLSVMPTNLYGPGDTFDVQESHVIPGLIKRMYECKVNNIQDFRLWGTGTPLREFMFSEDCADAILYLLENMHHPVLSDHLSFHSYVNIGSGEEISIAQLARTIAEILRYDGKITCDTSKPDGTPRKLLDSRVLRSLGWQCKTHLREGLETTIKCFLNREF